MKKLNNVLATCKVTAYGFPAFRGLEEHSNPSGEPVIISTLSAPVMADMGIEAYYAPVIPRGTVFSDADQVIEADLDLNCVHVWHIDDVPQDTPVIIASRHPGTVELLQSMYPNHTIMASVTPDDIIGRHVVGTLPPHLISYAASFRAVAIKEFDYTKDGDLSGEELRDRMVITGTVRVLVD